MMKKPTLKSQTTIVSALAICGLVCAWVQNTYYGYIDDQGIVHDSLFLPLSAIFIMLSFGLAIIVITQFLINKLSSKTNKES